MPGTVIQGFFPNGLGRLTAGQSIQPKAASGPPAWVQQRIAMEQRTIAPAPSAPAQRPVMQRMTPSGSAIELSPNMARFGNDAGQPLPTDVRHKMESVFGTNFNDVRVHVGAHAASIGALAFTHGSHIHFAPGQYAPNTPQGQRILGHELAHVVQQRCGRVRNPFNAGVAVVHDANLEGEAERMALRAATPAKKACCDECAEVVQPAARASTNPFASNKKAKKAKATARAQASVAEDAAKAFKLCLSEVKFVGTFQKHVMEGEDAGTSHTGYHSENAKTGVQFGACKMGDENDAKVYSGSCRKSGKAVFKDSTFFPKTWDIAKIRNEVAHAFCKAEASAKECEGVPWCGEAETAGIVIGGFGSKAAVETAFPVIT